MADKAQSEPTMEEILASIRKIIADDGETSRPAARSESQSSGSVDVNVAGDDDFDDLSLDDVMSETEEDDAFDNTSERYLSGEQSHTEQRHDAGESDFDLMEDADTSGNMLADVDDDMFDDLGDRGSEADQSGEFAPQTPQSYDNQPHAFDDSDDDLEDFDFGLAEEDDTPVAESPAVRRAADSPGATWTPEELAAPQTEADPDMDQPSYMDSESEPDFMTEQDAGNDPFAGVAPQPEPETSWEPAAQETSFAPDIDQAPPVDVEPETEPAIADMAAPEPEPQMTESYTSSASQGGEALTDERIAGAAATALGKLMVKRSSSEEETNPNTLDGLMRELLRPMIKEWLDANLPAIVERKVEEEVQRIARMAR
tara:strand:+ start:655 stop:1767 length:1113 start_codon:yes stop_codon:yes gene_type:complete